MLKSYFHCAIDSSFIKSCHKIPQISSTKDKPFLDKPTLQLTLEMISSQASPSNKPINDKFETILLSEGLYV